MAPPHLGFCVDGVVLPSAGGFDGLLLVTRSCDNPFFHFRFREGSERGGLVQEREEMRVGVRVYVHAMNGDV